MKRNLLNSFAIVAAVCVTPGSDAVLAFQVDANIKDVRRELEIGTVADLGVGDRGLVDGDAVQLCVRRKELKIVGTSPLIAVPGAERVLLDLHRMPVDSFEVKLASNDGQVSGAALRQVVMRVAEAPSCGRTYPKEKLFGVRDLFGATTFKALLVEVRAGIAIEAASTATALADAQALAEERAQATAKARAQVAGLGEGDAGVSLIDRWLVSSTQASDSSVGSVIISTEAQGDTNTALALRCLAGQTTVYLLTDHFLGTDAPDNYSVLAGYDDRPLQSLDAVVATSRRSFFLDNPIAKAVLFLGATTYTVEYMDHEAKKHVATFPLYGLDKHLPALRKTCDW
jgi:hypothetical protein